MYVLQQLVSGTPLAQGQCAYINTNSEEIEIQAIASTGELTCHRWLGDVQLSPAQLAATLAHTAWLYI